MFNALKDRASSHAVRLLCNKLLARYGSVQELQIDTTRHRLEMVVLLAGDSAPIAVIVENYVITSDHDKKFIHVMASRCTRPWVRHLLEDQAHGRKFPLPAWAAVVL